MPAGKIIAMQDISVQDSELLPVILEPLTSAALHAASGRSDRRNDQGSAQKPSSPASSVPGAPALDTLKVIAFIWASFGIGISASSKNLCLSAFLQSTTGKSQAHGSLSFELSTDRACIS